MKISLGPKTRFSLIHRMRVLDPEGWSAFCTIYRHRLVGLAAHFGFEADAAEDIASRVIKRLFEEFRDRNTPIDGPFRKRLKRLVKQEMNGYRYESQRFYGQRQSWIRRGAARLMFYRSDPSDEFAESVSADLSPRLRHVHDLIERLRRKIDPATWETFVRIRIMEETYEDLAVEWNVPKTVLRSRVYRVVKQIEKLAGKTPLATISSQTGDSSALARAAGPSLNSPFEDQDLEEREISD